MTTLTRSEEILLLAILRLKDNAYATTILKEVKSRTGKELTFGSIWVSLDVLYKKGYINKIISNETPAHGGRKIVFYTLTKVGLNILQEAREFQNLLWRGASSHIKKYGRTP
ncbi:hypothetical protein ACFLT9_09140 [Acidobacteriota bacterium]